MKSKLPNPVLAKIWKLADVDKDGQLDKDEFALGMHLINVKLNGGEIPVQLPDHLIPPKKKDKVCGKQFSFRGFSKVCFSGRCRKNTEAATQIKTLK